MICNKCHNDLPDSEFPFRDKSKNIRRRECKSCNRQLQQIIYQRNVAFINQWKSQGCRKCGELNYIVIDAHHIDNNKEANICIFKVNASL